MASTTLVVPHPAVQALTAAHFQHLAEVPPEIEWFGNLTNANTRRAYRQDIDDFMAFAGLRQPEQFRHITRAHVIAWREQLAGQGLANDTIRRKLAALSSLYAYLCDRNAVLHNPVLGVKRPRSMNREGVTPALGDHHASWRLYASLQADLWVKRQQAGRAAGDGAEPAEDLKTPLFRPVKNNRPKPWPNLCTRRPSIRTS